MPAVTGMTIVACSGRAAAGSPTLHPIELKFSGLEPSEAAQANPAALVAPIGSSSGPEGREGTADDVPRRWTSWDCGRGRVLPRQC
ncbi:MAG: hypothetical protein AAF628_37470 [Planctomycetota bacterium]